MTQSADFKETLLPWEKSGEGGNVLPRETLWCSLQVAAPFDAPRLLRTGCGKLAFQRFYRAHVFSYFPVFSVPSESSVVKKHRFYGNGDRFRRRLWLWRTGHMGKFHSPPPRSSPRKGEEEFGSGLLLGFAMTRLPPQDFAVAGKCGWIPDNRTLGTISGMTEEHLGFSLIPFIPFIPVN